MFSFAAPNEAASGWRTVLVICLLMMITVGSAIQWNGNWAFACDFNCGDLSQATIPGDQCGGRCAGTPGCSHFTWTTWNGGTCFMKQGQGSKADAFATTDSSMVCGVIDTIQWNGNWAFGCDFVGNDLSSARISSDQCGGYCASTSGCTHFTWTSYAGGTCFMKLGSVSKADAFKTSDNTMVCGVVDGAVVTPTGVTPIGPTMDGKTTRYWDCCKPSCAWPGKAPVSSPVKTCQANGVTKLSDPNAVSGCNANNKQAYTCNDNQPWAINNNLAYGFAAANIKGSSENGWCCGCYKLDFTSGPVVGKSLIVQVTNTGGDLGENHFDLQMPGSGVGLFDGCTSQWGLPTPVWGQTYGGVTSRQACFGLPAAIQAGCLFRFDWFMGADNPTMKFAKVACPAELEARTQCVRNG
ncbi:Endoglucanase-5 [Hypsibius exemplaris]|uniref:Cellulase n=1 Tax=Hypsibius exemplaris TaxID=2072580 RepID=A0A1W0WLH6_HYPEX|nr:Endoglucanase-5 [Hypsibius exemplaris]